MAAALVLGSLTKSATASVTVISMPAKNKMIRSILSRVCSVVQEGERGDFIKLIFRTSLEPRQSRYCQLGSLCEEMSRREGCGSQEQERSGCLRAVMSTAGETDDMMALQAKDTTAIPKNKMDKNQLAIGAPAGGSMSSMEIMQRYISCHDHQLLLLASLPCARTALMMTAKFAWQHSRATIRLPQFSLLLWTTALLTKL